MSVIKKASIACALAVTVAAGSVVPVYATTSSSDVANKACSVTMQGTKNTTGASDSRWQINSDGKVTGTAVVVGDASCTQTVTLAVWQAPDADKGLPYSSQKLFGHVTESLAPGVHALTIQLPDCFYQVDMVRGNSVDTLPYPAGAMMGSLHGGTKTCEAAPAPTPTPTQTPVTPVTTTETPADTAAPAELPNTGVGTTAAVAAFAAAVLGTAFQYVRQLKRA